MQDKTLQHNTIARYLPYPGEHLANLSIFSYSAGESSKVKCCGFDDFDA